MHIVDFLCKCDKAHITSRPAVRDTVQWESSGSGGSWGSNPLCTTHYLCSLPVAAVTNHHKQWLNTREIHHLIVEQPRCLMSECWRDCFLLELRGGLCPTLSLLASGAAGNPWHSSDCQEACWPLTPSRPPLHRDLHTVSLRVSNLPLLSHVKVSIIDESRMSSS